MLHFAEFAGEKKAYTLFLVFLTAKNLYIRASEARIYKFFADSEVLCTSLRGMGNLIKKLPLLCTPTVLLVFACCTQF